MKRSYSLIIRRNSGPAAATGANGEESKLSRGHRKGWHILAPSTGVQRFRPQLSYHPDARRDSSPNESTNSAGSAASYALVEDLDPYSSLPGSPVTRQPRALPATSGHSHMLAGSVTSSAAAAPNPVGNGGGGHNIAAAESGTYSRTIKICVLGAPQVGKTALVVRFLTGRYIWEYSSMEWTYLHQIKSSFLDADDSSNENILLEILDCNTLSGRSGNGKKLSLARKANLTQLCHIPTADGYLLVFALDDAKSFTVLAELLPRLPIAAPVLLVANKQDLDHIRAVPDDALHDLAEQWNLHFVEASAREDRNSAEQPFIKISREILGKLGTKKRKPSQRIFESLNKMLGQIVQK